MTQTTVERHYSAFFLCAGHINNCNSCTSYKWKRADCNKLGAYYKFKQYEHQEMKNNSIIVWDTASQSTKW